MSESELGLRLDASGGEGFALKRLETPIQENAVFRLRYRSAADGRTRNGCFCFGDAASNDDLFKAGTLMGMNRHGIFPGGWNNHDQGAHVAAEVQADEEFEASIEIDLEHGKVVLRIGEDTVTSELPPDLESVTHVGIYAKGTVTDFSRIERL